MTTPVLAMRPFRPHLFNRQVNSAAGADACWPWRGRPNHEGYGNYGKGGQGAHRVAYELAYGPIPEGLVIDHVCHSRDTECVGGKGCPHRLCVNPAHLEAVTQRENLLRSLLTMPNVNAAKTHCKRGHPYDEANTRWGVTRKGGPKRDCRACLRIHGRLRAQRNRALLTGAAS